ncbi:Plasmid stabilization system protein [Treponema sp. JC4]|uniref:type II toxin-antitoxin system RelE/ParE family toxin n=1 Tax=Treponema sp. JC4 TaxID=1124982 RepID=UPI00025B05CF|nr:type II toxin-antitoxin system RelE/ParE family toxin [Treponema sp. JC4]EID84031.1 Plasmid stabilization system protein [Treponema sp. JC4]
MDYKVVLSDNAKADISRIYGYILNKLKSSINADAVLKRLYSSMEDLCFMADSYHLYPNEPWHSIGIRYYTIGNHSVMYTIENDTATVLHVAYGRRDLDKVMGDYK